MVGLIAIEGALGDARIDPPPGYYGSFVHKIFEKWPHSKTRFYIPGPDPMAPATVEAAAQIAASQAVVYAKAFKAKGIFIVGYSLGGASAIRAARKLKDMGMQVDCLALFDAIDPHFMAKTVPDNIVHGMHGYRSRDSDSRPLWPKAGWFGRIKRFEVKITHWGASGVLITQGLAGQMPQGSKPSDLVTEDDIVIKGRRRKTACTWADDLAGVRELNVKMQRHIDDAYAETVIKFKTPNPDAPGSDGESYRVVAGDSLSIIAGKFWHDVLLWPLIYDANRAKIGPNPNFINIGLVLSIPDINQFTEQEKIAARARGRAS